MESFENREIEVTCPDCDNRIQVKLIQVAHEEKIICPGCQKKIQLRDKDGNVKKSLEAFRKLGNSVTNIKINLKTPEK
jgi:uncharacterized paraquat-inducible protein A